MSYITLYLAIALFACGVLTGWIIAKFYSNRASVHRKELEAKLKHSEQSHARFKDQVSEHFTKTASLINEMTANYQQVYAHLAQGATSLCNNQVVINSLSSIVEVPNTTKDTSQYLQEAPSVTVTDGVDSEPPLTTVPDHAICAPTDYPVDYVEPSTRQKTNQSSAAD